jgi:hypothetical protein
MSEVVELQDNPQRRVQSNVDMSDDANLIPEQDQWSWNPKDWYQGTRREIVQFNWKLTEKRKELLKVTLGEGLVTFLFLFTVMGYFLLIKLLVLITEDKIPKKI